MKNALTKQKSMHACLEEYLHSIHEIWRWQVIYNSHFHGSYSNPLAHCKNNLIPRLLTSAGPLQCSDWNRPHERRNSGCYNYMYMLGRRGSSSDIQLKQWQILVQLRVLEGGSKWSVFGDHMHDFWIHLVNDKQVIQDDTPVYAYHMIDSTQT